MKGYKLDRTLYIFDAEPAVIPVSVDDVDIIYVQQELLAAYVNANQDAASKIKPYNYKLIAVNKLPWADYIDNDLVEDGGGDTTEYTVSVNFGQTLLDNYHDGLPFEPSMPYTAAASSEIHFTLPYSYEGYVTGWYDYREGNTESEHVIQVQVPESIQDSYVIEYPDWQPDPDDPDNNSIGVNGRLSFTMPAENVTLNIDLVENPDYTVPPVETELTVVNNLPEGYTCEVAILSEGDEEPVPTEDINSNITVHENDMVFIKVFNENNEPVNYFNEADGFSNSYIWTHESAETMRQYNVYCSIEGDFNDEITTEDLGYHIWGQTIVPDNFGYGENFTMPSIPLTLTIQKP